MNKIEENYLSSRNVTAITPNSQIRSLLFAALRRLSRSPLKYTRGISCVRGRFYQNQFFSELMARGWVSSFSLTSRCGQRADTASSRVPHFVHIASHISDPDQTPVFLFFSPSRRSPVISNANYSRDGKLDTTLPLQALHFRSLSLCARLNSSREDAIEAEKNYVDFLNLFL